MTSSPPAEPGETWCDVLGYEGLYQASSHGRVWSVPRVTVQRNGRVRHLSGRILRTHTGPGGHHFLVLWRESEGQSRLVHHLVAEAFIGPRPDGMEVCHGPRKSEDGSVCDRVDNLSYGTRSKNAGEDRRRDGTLIAGESHPFARLTDEGVREIRRLHAVGLGAEHPRHNRWCRDVHWSPARLADVFGVNDTTVKKVIRGTAWAHVTETEAA